MGRICFAIGDPWIYNEYIDHDRLPESFENRKAAENLTELLLSYAKKRHGAIKRLETAERRFHSEEAEITYKYNRSIKLI